MSRSFGWSDDYAWMRTGDLEFYYGYEVTKRADPYSTGDNDSEFLWCFQAKKAGVILETWAYGELGMSVANSSECVDCLLSGISKFLAKYPPQVPE